VAGGVLMAIAAAVAASLRPGPDVEDGPVPAEER